MSALTCPNCGNHWDAAPSAGAGPVRCPSCKEQIEAPGQGAIPSGGGLPDPFPGEFRFLRELGEGTFGKVWLTDDLLLGRRVAVKALKLAGREEEEIAARRALFDREARLMASVRHPNVVQIHAARSAGSDLFLVLQYVPGGSLKDLLKRDGALDWPRASRFVADVGEGLFQVHARGIVHRDIKPANVLWDSEADEALLTDFGVANWLADARTAAGTALYMAPEVFEGRASERSDVYSLAATLFHLVAGQPPFWGVTTEALRDRIWQGLPEPDPRCARLPRPVEEAVRAGLRAERERRPPLGDFLDGLRAALNASVADSWETRTHPGPADLPTESVRMLVSRVEPSGAVSPLLSSRPPPEKLERDVKRVPALPDRVGVRTGERLRLDVEVDRPGFVTVFNVGPTGNLNLLYPREADAAPGPAPAGARLRVLDVELTPPAGRERLVALWSRRPLPVRLAELAALAAEGDAPVSPAYRASRDIVRVRDSLKQLDPADWRAAVLELDHRGG